ncbi:MAG TPA: serine/threonine-protein kinase [Candidatus Polarisedimenticolaceae bacterium]|nr:serine/threonine-protein kinase [Candidatus Polarisedimenticolaceae bacterium]
MSRIGRYLVASEVGRGAMGVVYLATDPRLKRQVAVKTMRWPDGLTERQQSEFRERFLREAHAAAALSHAGIVTVYDAGEDAASAQPFIAMEYVEGCSLRQRLDRDGPIEVGRAAEIAGAVADALHAAHERGIVHRDVKPANLLIRSADGAVKVTDFGVARVTNSELTQSGAGLGTPAYMSPEQIRGEPLDGRSDLFSLGVILYESLSGERPFDGETVPSVIHSITLETPIPITKRTPGLPRGLDPFFDRALAKRPADRFPDGHAFRLALEAALGCRDSPHTATVGALASGTSPAPATPLPPADRSLPWWRRRPRVAAAGALIAFLAVWLIAAWGGDAYLHLEAKSSVDDGELTVLVDGTEVYRRWLDAPEQPKGLLKKMLEQSHETFEAYIEIPPGKREVTAHVVHDGQSRPDRATIVLDIERGETRKLRLVAGRALGSSVSLKVQ